MTDQHSKGEPKPDDQEESVTEESGAGYGNNAENDGTAAPGEDGMNSDQR